MLLILNNKGATLNVITGNVRSVDIDDKTAAQMRNNWVTHNHPTGKGTKGLERFGYSLSSADVYQAIKCNTRGIIAESPTYRYKIERPANGWSVSADEARKRYGEIYNSIAKKYSNFIKKRPDAKLLMQHLVMKQLSKEFNLNYSYQKI